MSNRAHRYLRLETYGGGTTAYLELADHPHQLVSGIVARSVAIHQLVPDYHGPALYLQFDELGRAIGMEILYSSADINGPVE